jgi:hypothetical protein
MASDGKRASLQTFHALQATDLAAAINDALKKVRVGPGDYRVELTVPEGPSTSGGVQAMQHVRLVPPAGSGPPPPTLVVGHANHSAGNAELRTFDHVDAIHRRRFGRPLAIDRTEYGDFIALARQLFVALHLETTVVGPPAEPEENAGPATRAGKALFALVACVALAVLGTVLFAALRAR